MTRDTQLMRARWVRAGIGVLGWTFIGSGAMAVDGLIEAIHLEGDAAEGTGRLFQAFDRPSPGAGGLVAFTADLTGATTGDDVVCRGATPVAQEGAAAPGVDGGIYDYFEFFETQRQINLNGDVVYIATLGNVDDNMNRALYRNDELVALEGMVVVAIPDAHYRDFGFAGIADDGRIAFLAELDGPSAGNSAILFGDDMLYRKGGPVPGLDGITFDGIFDEVQVNGRGDLLFEANTSLPSSEDRMLIRRMTAEGGAVAEDIVAREGQTVATEVGPDVLGLIQQAALASDGSWAMRGNLGNAGPEFDSIILSSSGFQRQEGDPVPAIPGAAIGMITAISANRHGDVVFLSGISNAGPTVTEGIFTGDTLLVTDGMPAPGLPEGTVFTDIGFEDVIIDDQRQITFSASYGGSTSGDGLFRIYLENPCPGDVDHDQMVGAGDLILVIDAWGACPIGATCTTDVNGDGSTGFSDLIAVVDRWGPCGS